MVVRHVLACSRATRSAASQIHENFFKYTFGRWIYEEERQLALRYRRFDVDALKAQATSCTGSAVTDMETIGEGQSNKVFLLKLEHGNEVIARVPTPAAGPSHLVTASEVATIDFVRSCLDLPVPKVLSWCSGSSETPVEAEYIIMEKARGVVLRNVWDELSPEQKDDVVREVVKLESRLAQSFTSMGYSSLYYRGDVSEASSLECSVDQKRCERLVLGPCVKPQFWRDRRDTLQADAGSRKDPLSYLKAIAKRERAWITRYASQHSNINAPFAPPAHIANPEAHLKLLDAYEAITPYIDPQCVDGDRPSLRCDDANTGNIFLDNALLSKGEAKISAIIDWQHTLVLPLCPQAQIPRFLEFEADAYAHLPDLTKELKDRQELYKASSASLNPEYAACLTVEQREFVAYIPSYAGRTWLRGFVPLRHTLMKLRRIWPHVFDDPCPLNFTDEEYRAYDKDATDWNNHRETMALIDASVGVEDGWVPVDGYDSAIQANKEAQTMFRANMQKGGYSSKEAEELMKLWPYPLPHE